MYCNSYLLILLGICAIKLASEFMAIKLIAGKYRYGSQLHIALNKNDVIQKNIILKDAQTWKIVKNKSMFSNIHTAFSIHCIV